MKKNMTKVMAMGMVLTMLAGTTVFAVDRTATNDMAAAGSEMDVKEEGFTTDSGKIVSVEKSGTDGVSVVEIENKNGGLRFAVDANSLILDRKDGSYKTVADLTEGMEVAVVYSANSPMGMSLPPYLGSVTAVVANADADNMMVGHFGDDLTDETNKLQLNISDETRILNMEGAKIKLSAADVKNRDALVFYYVTTRSIPAQTTPSLVLLLTQAEEAGEEMGNEPKMQAQIMVPLREAAKENGYTVKFADGQTLSGRTIVYAAGTYRRRLNIKGEHEFSARGISYCAVCDGAFYKDKDTAVIGGGDTALSDALFLSDIAKNVYVIHRRDAFRANEALVEKVKQIPNITLILNAVPVEFIGDNMLTAVKYILNGEEKTLPVGGSFTAIGSIPNTDMLKGIAELDDNGYIAAGEDGVTSAKGIFAAGDVRTKSLRQVITAAADGANCIDSIKKYLQQ